MSGTEHGKNSIVVTLLLEVIKGCGSIFFFPVAGSARQVLCHQATVSSLSFFILRQGLDNLLGLALVHRLASAHCISINGFLKSLLSLLNSWD